MTRKSKGTMQLPIFPTNFAHTLTGRLSSTWYTASVSSTLIAALEINQFDLVRYYYVFSLFLFPQCWDYALAACHYHSQMLTLFCSLLSSSRIVMVVNPWPIVMSELKPNLKRLTSKDSASSSWLESTIPTMKQRLLVQASTWIFPSSVT